MKVNLTSSLRYAGAIANAISDNSYFDDVLVQVASNVWEGEVEDYDEAHDLRNNIGYAMLRADIPEDEYEFSNIVENDEE